MPCKYCKTKEFCINCPTITSVQAPMTVNINEPYEIIVNIKSNAVFFGDTIDVCLFEGGIPTPTNSSGNFDLPKGDTVSVTFTQIATAVVGKLFYTAAIVVGNNVCSDLKNFEISVTFTPKYYSCVNGVCVEDPYGTYNEPTCGGICVPPTRKYKCIGGYCTQDPTGTFTDPNCNNTCITEKRYDCVDGKCVLTPGGPFTDSNCYGGCVTPVESHNECVNNICTRVPGKGVNECSPLYV